MPDRIVLSALVSAMLALSACATGETPRTNDAAFARQASCQTATATRIPVTVDGVPCSGPGRSYSSKQIDLTGASTASDALRLLDPSVNTTGH